MLNQDQLDKLRAEHKRIAHLIGDEKGQVRRAGEEPPWEVVFKPPKRVQYKMFRSMMHNPSQVADSQEWLARATVAYPSAEAFDALLEDYPAISEVAAPKILELIGMSQELAEKA
jgi:hypothetical protein